MEDNFWDCRSSVRARGHTLVLALHLYAERSEKTFADCFRCDDDLLDMCAEFFQDPLRAKDRDGFLHRLREVVKGQAGSDGQSARAASGFDHKSWLRADLRKLLFYLRGVAVRQRENTDITARQAEVAVSEA